MQSKNISFFYSFQAIEALENWALSRRLINHPEIRRRLVQLNASLPSSSTAASREKTKCGICKKSFSRTSDLKRGTGMIASSSTFRPHPGRVIRDLFRLLDAVTALYGSTSLQQSSKGSCSLLVSGYNLRADCQWRTLVPPLNSGANAAPASVLALM